MGVGIRCHSGWAAYVVLGGPFEEPTILERGRLELCDPAVAGSKQPFHEVEDAKLAAAMTFLAARRRSSRALAFGAIYEISKRLGKPRGCGLLTASGRALPGVRQILASHAMIHAAEGEFFRDAVDYAFSKAGIPVTRIRERDLEHLVDSIPVSAAKRKDRLAAFGRQVGSPWRQDEKFAALAAWLTLRPV